MQSIPLTLSSDTTAELLSAIAVIERQYPGYKIQLMPASVHGERALPKKSTAPRKAPDSNGKSNRELVEEACRRKALSLADLVDATGLEKNQIRGVLNAPTQKKHYERTEQNDGSKLYKYTGSSRE